VTPGVTDFGQTEKGETIHRLVLSNDILSAAILTLGCTLQDLRHTDIAHSLTVGSPDLSAYRTALRYCGAIVGPVANRIGGATAMIGGARYKFDANENNQHTLHGGREGTHALIWRIKDHGPDSATLSLDLPDGHGGFPGNRTLTARYALSDATLSLTLAATTDAPTLMNLANHSYWRLDDAATTQGQTLHIAADHTLPTDGDLLPTGTVALVASTRFDYRKGAILRTGKEGLIDTNFCLSPTRTALRDVASLTGRSGVSLTLATTEPGLQVYDGHSLTLPDITGNDGTPYTAYAGLALEAQFWPDAPNNPTFPDITLRPGQDWQQTTTWTISA